MELVERLSFLRLWIDFAHDIHNICWHCFLSSGDGVWEIGGVVMDALYARWVLVYGALYQAPTSF
jgi:hypothetical protein